MRLRDPDTMQMLALYALPVVVAVFGFGVPGAILLTLVVAFAGIVVRSRRILEADGSATVELHTITYSHYVEKVRWCLDRTGVAYTEIPSIGILGLLLTGRTVPLLVLPQVRTQVGDSPQILRFLWGRYAAELPPERIRFLEPTPEALALEQRFDIKLGVPVRRWSYWHLLRQPDLTLMFWGADEPDIPLWQRRVLPTLQPLLAALLRRMLGITDASATAGLVSTKEVFAEVDAMLADGRRYLLGGDEPTFVDITFASLAALALFPRGYGGPKATVQEAPIDRLAPAWRAEVEALRATRSGQFVERMYREERMRR
jgi:glutathione S-transferase